MPVATIDPSGLRDASFAGTYAAHLVRDSVATYRAVKHNLAASAAPTVNDDSSADYAVGSIWVDTTNEATYVCADASAGAALWMRSAVKDNLSSNVSPGGTNGFAEGYSLGSVWMNTSDPSARAFFFMGEDAGTAVWLELPPAANTAPSAVARAGAEGSSNRYARADHVHDAGLAIAEKTAGFSLASTDDYLRITSASALTVTLPDPATVGARRWHLLLSHDTPGDVTLQRNGTETIQGVAADYVLEGAWSRWELVCDGTNWWLF